MAEVASTNDCAGPERRDPDLVCDVVGEVAEDGLRDTNACANSDQPAKHNRWCPRRRLSPNDLEHAPTGSEQLNGTRSRQLGSHHDPPPHPHPHTLSQLSEPGSHLPVPSSQFWVFDPLHVLSISACCFYSTYLSYPSKHLNSAHRPPTLTDTRFITVKAEATVHFCRRCGKVCKLLSLYVCDRQGQRYLLPIAYPSSVQFHSI